MVGASPSTPPVGIDRLVDLLGGTERVLVLTGAGMSTRSGIPDYRDASGGWKRPAPIQYREFVDTETGRRRYWARSMIGWQSFGRAQPNAAHAALARMETRGPVHHLVTQNVDGLHDVAGSRRVTDLHGRLDRVVCLACGATVHREALQARLADLNPGFQVEVAARAPDGDADIPGGACEGFAVPDCETCGGLLKPDVVFFGESVPRPRVEGVMTSLASAGVLLVAGSSLMVFSGFRFVREAVRLGTPVAAVNVGRTRADDVLSVKVEGDVCEVLPALARALGC